MPPCLFGEILLRESVEIASRRLCPERHCTVEPCCDLGFRAPEQVATKIGRYLDGELELAASQSLIELSGALDLGSLGEITRAGKVLEKFAALARAILVERRVGQILNVERDPVPECCQQNHRAEERESEPHRIPENLHGFATCVRPEPTNVETQVSDFCRVGRRRGGRFRRNLGDRTAILSAGRVLKILDECRFECRNTALSGDLVWSPDCEDPASVHKGDPVATLRLIHEVRGQENGDAVRA